MRSAYKHLRWMFSAASPSKVHILPLDVSMPQPSLLQNQAVDGWHYPKCRTSKHDILIVSYDLQRGIWCAVTVGHWARPEIVEWLFKMAYPVRARAAPHVISEPTNRNLVYWCTRVACAISHVCSGCCDRNTSRGCTFISRSPGALEVCFGVVELDRWNKF